MAEPGTVNQRAITVRSSHHCRIRGRTTHPSPVDVHRFFSLLLLLLILRLLARRAVDRAPHRRSQRVVRRVSHRRLRRRRVRAQLRERRPLLPHLLRQHVLQRAPRLRRPYRVEQMMHVVQEQRDLFDATRVRRRRRARRVDERDESRERLRVQSLELLAQVHALALAEIQLALLERRVRDDRLRGGGVWGVGGMIGRREARTDRSVDRSVGSARAGGREGWI
eukprot:31312-Pelagococcus_subviridis.AAC.9